MEIAQLSFNLEALGKIVLPEYKGSTFHGGFSHALMRVSPRIATQLFDPGIRPANNTPNPYLLVPPLDERGIYLQGEQFTFTLTLIGRAVRYAPIVHSAVDYFGEEMGLGAQQGKFRILDITHSRPELMSPSTRLGAVKFRLLTRMRLKKDKKLCRLAPNFSIFANNLMQRIENLDKAFGENQPGLKQTQDLVEAAKIIRTRNARTKWDDWSRYSNRQKEWMKFGGLTGEIGYYGDLAPFNDFFQLGQWLHLGGKTSFGFGKYEMSFGS